MNIKEIQKVAEDKIDTIAKTSIEVMELIAITAYNQAIEDAAKLIDELTVNEADFAAHRIRELKK